MHADCAELQRLVPAGSDSLLECLRQVRGMFTIMEIKPRCSHKLLRLGAGRAFWRSGVRRWPVTVAGLLDGIGQGP